MEPDKAVRLARNRALSACLGADTAARQTCRDGHVYCKRPNRLPVFTYKPCVLPLAILVECPSAAGNVGEFFASPRLYGGLKGKMTVRTMDIIIGATIALIVLVIIIGVVS